MDIAFNFALAGPFIALLIGFVKGLVDIPTKLIPLVALILAYAWGAVLWKAGYTDGGFDLAQFVVTGFFTAAIASGAREITASTIGKTDTNTP